eukprot:m51a1_g3814 hypothetical protein (691) ;mRNA; r:264237-266883
MEQALVLLAALALLASARPFTAHDLHAIRRLGAPVSDGNSSFVFTVTEWNEEENKKTQNLWIGSTQPGTSPKNLAPLDHVLDYDQQWTPDARTLLFLSTRGGVSGLWAVRVSTGAVYKVAEFPVDAANLKLSPRGSYAAITAQVYPGMSMEQTAQRDSEASKTRHHAYAFDSLFIRRWDEWWLGKFNHVFVFKLSHDAGTDTWEADVSSAVDVMGETRGDCPSRPSGGPEEFAWSADESEIAYTTQVGRDMAWSTDLNIYIVDLSRMHTTCVTCDNKATDTHPLYSPDGSKFAYLAMSTPAYEADIKHIVVMDRATGRKTMVTGSWDRSVDLFAWSDDSRSVIALAGDNARNKLFSVDMSSGAVRAVVSEHSTEGFGWVKCYDRPSQNCLVISRSSLMSPSAVFVLSSRGSLRQVGDFNSDKLSGVEVTDIREYSYTGANGDQILGWITMPRGFKEGAKYPLVLYIHGGPEGAWLDNWGYRWNSLTVAAEGYAVFAPNLHGSTSFGSNFTRAVLRDWGGKPFEDVMLGLESVLGAHPWMDRTRVAAMGASFGGFMINWLNGHTNGVFKCLIFHDGIFDTKDFYYTTDELFFAENEFGGSAFDPAAEETYKKNSPSTYAANFNTPELVIHGGKDYRIVDGTGISTFTLLQRKGVPSRMVYFPNAAHTITEPNDSIYWHDEVLSWLASWLKA